MCVHMLLPVFFVMLREIIINETKNTHLSAFPEYSVDGGASLAARLFPIVSVLLVSMCVMCPCALCAHAAPKDNKQCNIN